MKYLIALAFLAAASASPRHALPPPSLPKVEGLEMLDFHLPGVPIPVVDITPNGASLKLEKVSIIETPEEMPEQRKKRSLEDAEESVRVVESADGVMSFDPTKTARFVESADGVLSFVSADEATPAEAQMEPVKFVDSPINEEADAKESVRVVESADGVITFEPVKTVRFIESADGVLSFVSADVAIPEAQEETVKVAESPINDVNSKVSVHVVESADGIISFEPVKTARFIESSDGVLSFVSADAESSAAQTQETVKIVESADEVISFEPVKIARFIESADGVLSFVSADEAILEAQVEAVKVVDSPLNEGATAEQSVRVVESADGVISFVPVAVEYVVPVPVQMRN